MRSDIDDEEGFRTLEEEDLLEEGGSLTVGDTSVSLEGFPFLIGEVEAGGGSVEEEDDAEEMKVG